MTFKAYLLRNYTQQTTESYLRVIDKFVSIHPSAQEFTYVDIIHALQDFGSVSSRVLSALKQFYLYQMLVGNRSNHPCRTLNLKSTKRAIQFQDLFSPSDLDLLLSRECRYSRLAARNKSIIGLLIYQGLKPNNMVALRVSDIDLDNGLVYVRATRQLRKRVLHLKARQIKSLIEYIEEDRNILNVSNTNALFISKSGHPLSVDSLNRILHPLQSLFPDKALNAKTIRQSVISNWLNVENLSLEKCFEYSGHKWLSSTERYKREDISKRVNLLDKFHPNISGKSV